MAVGQTVKHSFRHTLAESHIAAIAIAVLLVAAIQELGAFLFGAPFENVVLFLVEAISTFDFTSGYQSLDIARGFRTSFPLLLAALACLGAAFLLSRWVYGVGLFRSLRRYRTESVWRNHV